MKIFLTFAMLLLSNAANARYHYHGYHGYSGNLKASDVCLYAGAIFGVYFLVELLKYLDRHSKRLRK